MARIRLPELRVKRVQARDPEYTEGSLCPGSASLFSVCAFSRHVNRVVVSFQSHVRDRQHIFSCCVEILRTFVLERNCPDMVSSSIIHAPTPAPIAMSWLEVFGPSARVHSCQVRKLNSCNLHPATSKQKKDGRNRPFRSRPEYRSASSRLNVDVDRGNQQLGIGFCHTERQYRSNSYVRGSIWNTKNRKLESLGRFDWKFIPTFKPRAIPGD